MDEPGVVYKFENGRVSVEDRREGYGVIPPEIKRKLDAETIESEGALWFLKRTNRDFKRSAS